MNEERLEVVAVVAKGAPGAKGDKGDPGLSPGVRRAIIYLFVFTLILAAANLLWTGHAVSANTAAERHAGQLVEQKLCATLGQLAALQPPGRADVKPGQPYPPSFAYEDNLHATLAQLGTDVGCPPDQKEQQ